MISSQLSFFLHGSVFQPTLMKQNNETKTDKQNFEKFKLTIFIHGKHGTILKLKRASILANNFTPIFRSQSLPRCLFSAWYHTSLLRHRAHYKGRDKHQTPWPGAEWRPGHRICTHEKYNNDDTKLARLCNR